MGEREDIIANLRQLVELDRGFGVEFVPLAPNAPSPASARATPVAAPARAQPPVAMAPTARAAPAAAASASIAAAIAPSPVAAPSADAWVPAPDLFTRPASEALATVAAVTATCRRCPLCAARTTVVPGEGSASAELLFIGEAPGADEDASGRPFVGPAGELLDRMIVAMGLARAEVFIANVVKCRPPGNRVPEPGEVAACMPFLRAQIAALKPRIICTLGNVPLKALFGDEVPGITRSRGQKMSYQGIPVIPTFHPSYLLRNPAAKKPCWDDLQVVLRELGRTPPARA